MNNSIEEIKIAQAIAYLEMYADPSKAREAAAKNNELISSDQWAKAEVSPCDRLTVAEIMELVR